MIKIRSTNILKKTLRQSEQHHIHTHTYTDMYMYINMTLKYKNALDKKTQNQT